MKTWDEMTPAEREEDWRKKFPNAKRPPCPDCENPHLPLPLDAKGKPDHRYCEPNDARLNAEDFANLGRRFHEMLTFVGFYEYDDKISEQVFQGDWWRLLMSEKTNPWERGAAGVEIMKRLERVRRDLFLLEALCAKQTVDWTRTAESYEARYRDVATAEKVEAATKRKAKAEQAKMEPKRKRRAAKP